MISIKNYTREIPIIVGPTGPAYTNIVSPVNPNNPRLNDLWFDTTTTPPILKYWNGTSWIAINNSSSITNTNPPNPIIGQTWLDTSTNPPTLKYWNGSSWSNISYFNGPTGPASPPATVGPTGPTGNVITTQFNYLASPPPSPVNGQIYFDTALNKLRLYNNTWINFTINTITAIIPTYNISGPTISNEGDNIILTITTTNVSNGTVIPYTITGVNSADISIPLTGNITINSNSGSISFNILNDVTTEGNETLLFTLGSNLVTHSILINDTSFNDLLDWYYYSDGTDIIEDYEYSL